MKKLLLFIVALSCLLVFQTQVLCEEANADKLSIIQAHIKPDEIKAYVGVYDLKGENIDAVDKSRLTALLGDRKLEVTDLQRFDSSGEGAAYVFLVDISKSLDTKQSTKLKETLNAILEKTGKDDRIAIVSFGDDVSTIQDFTSDKEILRKKINDIQVKDNNTNLYKGTVRALEMISSKAGDLPSRRAVIIVSDGEESHDGGITRDEVYMKIKEIHIPIYTVAFYKKSANAENKAYEKILGSFARTSNGQDFLLDYENSSVQSITDTIKNSINKSFAVTVNLGGIKADGKSYYLKLRLEKDDKSFMEDGLDIRVDSQEFSPSSAQASGTPAAKMTGGNDGISKDNMAVKFVKEHKGISMLVFIVLALVIIFAGFLVIKRIRSNKENSGMPQINPEEISLSEGEIATGMDYGKTNSVDNMDRYKTGYISPEDAGTIGKTIPLDSGLAGADSTPPLPPSGEGMRGNGTLIKLTRLGRRKEDKTYEVNVAGELMIGRDPSKAGLVFKEDAQLSGQHCKLIFRDGMLFVADLKSTNGTYVNGVSISDTYRLANDDILLIGSMELRVNFKE